MMKAFDRSKKYRVMVFTDRNQFVDWQYDNEDTVEIWQITPTINIDGGYQDWSISIVYSYKEEDLPLGD